MDSPAGGNCFRSLISRWGIKAFLLSSQDAWCWAAVYLNRLPLKNSRFPITIPQAAQEAPTGLLNGSADGEELLIPGGRSAQGGTEKEILLCEIKNVRAQGYRMPNGFLILKGSEAVLQERESAKKWPWTHNLRQRLKDEGALVANAKCFIFTRDTEFSSPSAAAAIVHGGHANGLTAWKNRKGTTLKEMEAM